MPRVAAVKEGEEDAVADLERMLSVIARSIVNYPDEVVVMSARGESFCHFELRCNESDVGALVGKRGSYADAMRVLLTAAAAQRKIRATMQILGGG